MTNMTHEELARAFLIFGFSYGLLNLGRGDQSVVFHLFP